LHPFSQAPAERGMDHRGRRAACAAREGHENLVDRTLYEEFDDCQRHCYGRPSDGCLECAELSEQFAFERA